MTHFRLLIFLLVCKLTLACDVILAYELERATLCHENDYQWTFKYGSVIEVECLTSAIKIQSTNLTRICKGMFNISHEVFTMDIFNSPIREIDNDAFENLDMLTYSIAITNANITRLKTHTFSNWNICKINLSRNKISVIEPETFLNLTHLVDIDLTFNNIKNLNSNAFVGVPNLKLFQLPNNEISSLTRDFLDFLPPVINVLDLTSNKISVVDGFFEKFKYLDKLCLSDNNLDYLGTDFLNVKLYKFVDVSGNNISFIHDEFFQGSVSLSALIVKDNPLDAHIMKKILKWANDNDIFLGFYGSDNDNNCRKTFSSFSTIILILCIYALVSRIII